MNNFKEFLDYVMSFYGDADALYPIDGLTREEVALAVLNYLDLCAYYEQQDKNWTSDYKVMVWGDGDSLDRERVRDLIINRRATKPQLPVFT